MAILLNPVKFCGFIIWFHGDTDLLPKNIHTSPFVAVVVIMTISVEYREE